MWDKLIGDATDAMPDFNDYLLIGFRKQKVHELVERIDNVFRETVKVFDNKLKYLGYRFLTPEERIDHCLNNAILRGSIEIQQSNFMLVQFEFEFEGVSHCTQINVPYMENFSLKLSDTEYYPLFPIVERGGLHHTKNDIIVKVMRAPLSFKRTEEYVIKTLSGITIQERVITAKIHQRSRRGKRLARTPAMLYHLAKYGLLGTFSYYNMDPNEIQIVQRHARTQGQFHPPGPGGAIRRDTVLPGGEGIHDTRRLERQPRRAPGPGTGIRAGNQHPGGNPPRPLPQERRAGRPPAAGQLEPGKEIGHFPVLHRGGEKIHGRGDRQLRERHQQAHQTGDTGKILLSEKGVARLAAGRPGRGGVPESGRRGEEAD